MATNPVAVNRFAANVACGIWSQVEASESAKSFVLFNGDTIPG